jgi:hypothetical protein
MSDAAKQQEESGATPQAAQIERNRASSEPDGANTDAKRPREIGGPSGPEPTRYGDWERAGRCVDF